VRTAAKAAECKAGHWLLTSRLLHSAVLAGRAGQWGAWRACMRTAATQA
jgi:hypothetical protein